MTPIIQGLEGIDLQLTNLDKIYWPEKNYSKADLIYYYYQVSPYLLPHLADRLLVMQRFPDGIYGEAFYQKECPPYAPSWIKTQAVQSPSSKRKIINYIICNNLPTLLWLVNQGCIEMHPWLSKCFTLDYPEALVFDLDPNQDASFADVLDVALLIYQVLSALGLKSFPKTSGATGLHIYVPLVPCYTYKQVREFAEKIALLVVEACPKLATIERAKIKRRSKVYIDYLQNVKGKTIASVFSVRPVPEATVSMPVTWNEIKDRSFSPRDFTIKNVPELLKNGRPDFHEVLEVKQHLKQI